MTREYTVLFDASCMSCSKLAAEIRQMSDGRISVEPLRGLWAQHKLSEAQKAELSGPCVVQVQASSEVVVYSGARMLMVLAKLLGPIKAFKVYGLARKELGTEPISKILSR